MCRLLEDFTTILVFVLTNVRFLGQESYCISYSLQRQYTENSKQIFPEMKLRGLVPNSYIPNSVSDLYILYFAAGK
jgi:hypothetical protein